MKLNAGIIFDHLQAEMPVKMLGRSSDKLHLERPQFYTGSEKSFEANHLYIVQADRLPQRPDLHADAVIICLGESMYLSTYRERCCVLQIDEETDFFSVANHVTNIFNRYDAWNEQLHEILDSTANIKEMLSCSSAIFENPLFVINSDFRIIADVEFEDKTWRSAFKPGDQDNLGLPTVAQFLEQHELSMHVKEPLLINMLDTSTLNTNLFINDEYLGCFTIDYRTRRHRQSDIALAKHLADLIVQAMKKLSSASSNKQGILKKALRDIVDGIPTTSEQHRVLEKANQNKNYLCIKLKLGASLTKLPLGYVCNEVENTFPRSIAFQYDSAVIGFIEIEDSDEDFAFRQSALKQEISNFIDVMDIFAGSSDGFDNLFRARLFYKQASAALEIGNLIHPNKRYFDFQDYALSELLLNAVDKLPVDMYYTQGMRRLIEHDKDAQVSYVNTLAVYLNNNMSITKTATDLFVHRSTLMERIGRIERELDTDLKDPDERLRIQLLLKAMEVQHQIRGLSDLAPSQREN